MPLEIRFASRRRDSCAITEEWNERRTIGSSRASAIPISSNHTRPRPGRRRSLPTTIHTLHLVLCSLIILSSLCVPVSATRSYSGRPRPRYGNLAGRLPRFESIEPDLDHFQPGDIVYDRRFPAAPVHYDIYKRQDAVNVDQSSKGGGAASTAQKHLRFSSTSTARPAAATTTTEAPFTTASLPASKSTSSQSGEPTLLVTAPGTESSSLPRPFDTGLGNNYTHPNCPVFMNSFLRNETFVSCVPFSLLLQVSPALFQPPPPLKTPDRTF